MDTLTLPDISQYTTAPLRLTSETRLDARPDQIFRALSDPDQMCRLFPWMHQVDVNFKRQPGEIHQLQRSLLTIRSDSDMMRRRCHFGNGMILEEEILYWDAPYGYLYRGIDDTHPFGMKGHVGSIQCLPELGKTRLIWEHHFNHANPNAMGEQLAQNVDMALNRLITCYGGLILNRVVTAEDGLSANR